MRRAVLLVSLVCLGTMVADAQIKISGSGRSGKPDVQYEIQVPDRANHTFSISQTKFTWDKPWEILGIRSKEGVDTGFSETIGNTARFRGFYVDTMVSGDKAFYRYQGTATLKQGAPQTYEARWTLVGGTGKLKGIKGKGTCKIQREADGGSLYECEGEYDPPK